MKNDDLSLALYKRTLNNIYELLERIHLKDRPEHFLNTKDDEGLQKFTKALILINKRSAIKRPIPFICHKTGNT